MARNIVIGQRVSSTKKKAAKFLRRAMTPAEKVLWRRLRTNRLKGFHFRRQQIIDGFIVDFYCHAAGLIVEVDGEIHARTKEADAERDGILSARGLRILRVSNGDVLDAIDGVLKRIAVNLTPRPPSLGGKGGTTSR